VEAPLKRTLTPRTTTKITTLRKAFREDRVPSAGVVIMLAEEVQVQIGEAVAEVAEAIISMPRRSSKNTSTRRRTTRVI
jgi:hypothetical protein